MQVLSNSVGRVMQCFGDRDCQETARFILLMDKFFDCANTRYFVYIDNDNNDDDLIKVQGAVLLKPVEDKLVFKSICLALKKELLNFCEMTHRISENPVNFIIVSNN